jgi:hypothetical protein
VLHATCRRAVHFVPCITNDYKVHRTASTYDGPSHSWNFIGPIVVSAQKFGTIEPSLMSQFWACNLHTKHTHTKRLYCFWLCLCSDCCRHITENLLAVLRITLGGAYGTDPCWESVCVYTRDVECSLRQAEYNCYLKPPRWAWFIRPMYLTHCVSGLPNFGLQPA